MKRRLFSEMGEHELVALGRCSWETQSGMPWTRRCGRKVHVGHFFCPEHEREFRHHYPHLSVPMRAHKRKMRIVDTRRDPHRPRHPKRVRTHRREALVRGHRVTYERRSGPYGRQTWVATVRSPRGAIVDIVETRDYRTLQKVLRGRGVLPVGEKAFDPRAPVFGPRKMTLADAKEVVRHHGLVLTKQDGEYRVNFKGGREGTAYYTDDLWDAVATGHHMATGRHMDPRRRR